MASEFCGTLIISRSLAQRRIDAARAFNPHVLYADATQRGSLRLQLDEKMLRADLRVVDDPLDPASPVRSGVRFVVERGRPGPVVA